MMYLRQLYVFCTVLLLGNPVSAASANKASTADAKLARISKLANASANNVIRLNTALYDELTTAPRPYSLSVIMTALGAQFKCQQCRDFDKEHSLVAQQWKKSAVEEGEHHFFAVLDFPDGQDVFRRLGLNTAPIVKFVHPTKTSGSAAKPDEQYDFRQGLVARPFAEWVVATKTSPVSFAFRQPVDYSKIATIFLIATALIFIVYRSWSVFGPLLTGRLPWALASISFILLMNSGYMWNQIRHAPYTSQSPNGKVSWIVGGYSNQVGAETTIISTLYALLALCVYAIFARTPKIADAARQRVALYTWLLMFVVLHAALTGLFKIKNPGYPFALLF